MTGWFNKVQGFFKGLGKKIKYGANKYIATPISHAAKAVYGTAKSVVNTLHKDARDLVSGIGGIIKRGQDTANNLINKGSSTLNSLGQSLSMPLLIGAGVLGGIFLLKK